MMDVQYFSLVKSCSVACCNALRNFSQIECIGARLPSSLRIMLLMLIATAASGVVFIWCCT